MWLCLDGPLVVCGAWMGFKAPQWEEPVYTNAIPRQIPSQPLLATPLATALLRGEPAPHVAARCLCARARKKPWPKDAAPKGPREGEQALKLKELRLICDTGEQLGVVKPADALKLADERGLRLVEVAAASKPTFEARDWLAPTASAMRVELRKRYGQGSLPHVWIGGEWVGGLSTGADGGLAGLADRGEIAPGKRADVLRVRAVGMVPVVREVWREGLRVA